MDNEPFVSLSEASRISGISRPTLRRILGRGGLEGFRSEADRRVRLVRLADLQDLKTPIPQRHPRNDAAELSVA